MKIKRVGVFDSGVGGLTVVKELRRIFPSLDIFYLGDTARLPYGDKSEKTIISYSLENSEFLSKFDIDLLIVACNTSSAVALNELKKGAKFEVVGMIEPGVSYLLKKTKNKRVGLIGTRATIRSKAYVNELKKIDKDVIVFEKACPLFVPIVEEGLYDDLVAELVAEKYLKEFKEKDIDSMLLGCTHYPLLIPVIEKVLRGVKLITSGEATVDFLKSNFKIENSKKEGLLKVYVTDIETHFIEVAKRLLNEDVKIEYAEMR